MNRQARPPNASGQPTPPQSNLAVVPAQQLFRGSKEVWIEHAGVRYRLRITRRNRLILQK
jgi:hemin uptake protein HemP